ncbi:DUF4148 domain-containing protein [Hydrogenophaga sp.]|uniref:DUF4148 domain-containing protein n=1 Tax=Hydrogenophaga sp. TaxID=1904254 RepID=UPI003567C3B8
MKTAYTATLVLALAALTTGQAMAETDVFASGKFVDSETGLMNLSPVANTGTQKTRAEVQAELAAYRVAKADRFYDSETGMLNLRAPRTPSQVTRAEVKAELAAYRNANKDTFYAAKTGAVRAN